MDELRIICFITRYIWTLYLNYQDLSITLTFDHIYVYRYGFRYHDDTMAEKNRDGTVFHILYFTIL